MNRDEQVLKLSLSAVEEGSLTGVKMQACYFCSEFVLILCGCEMKIA